MDDLISWSALKKCMVDHLREFGRDCDFMEAVEMADCAPTIEAEPVRHGRWEEKFFTNDRQRVCSVCHCTVRQPSYDKGETALFKYCPHCGAKMDGDS